MSLTKCAPAVVKTPLLDPSASRWRQLRERLVFLSAKGVSTVDESVAPCWLKKRDPGLMEMNSACEKVPAERKSKLKLSAVQFAGFTII
jgi:hypothetical protein